MTRRLMRPSEIRPLLRLRRPVIDPIERRLGKAQTIGDLRGIARRHTPRAVFDYADGEVSLQRARQLFRDIEFVPNVLRDDPVSDTEVTATRRRITANSDLPVKDAYRALIEQLATAANQPRG